MGHGANAYAVAPSRPVGGAAADIHTQLRVAAGRRDVHRALALCAQLKRIAAEQGAAQERPSPAPHATGDAGVPSLSAAYRPMMSVFGALAMDAEALALLDDADRVGHVPEAAVLDSALQAVVAAGHAAGVDAVLARYAALPAAAPPCDALTGSLARSWTRTTYEHMLHHCARTMNLEHAILLVQTAQRHSVRLSHSAQFYAVQCAISAQQPRLAQQLVQRFAASLPEDARRAHLWMHVLRGAADADCASCIPEAWEHAVARGGLVPDEGLALQILVVAGRAGHAQFADTLLHALPDMLRDVEVHEWHIAPVLDASCRAGRFREAIDLVVRMAQRGVAFSPPTFATLTAHAAVDDAALERAADALCAACAEPRAPPVSVLDAVLYAAADRGQLAVAERTLALCTPPGAPVGGGVQPGTKTYDVLLLSCVSAGDLSAGERAMASLAARGLEPTRTTLERLVRLHLQQPNCDAAFAVLEDTKARGLVPTRRTYAALVWSCWQQQDPRYHAVLQEMQEAQYEPGERLRALVDRSPLEAQPHHEAES
ncbi:hypothetical protein MSPP1_003114 [Malassezia sp. CBS 17886]|nr:hypothetical protein MSPP1_003114 [Malassezia sp. CBS 17886]